MEWKGDPPPKKKKKLAHTWIQTRWVSQVGYKRSADIQASQYLFAWQVGFASTYDLGLLCNHQGSEKGKSDLF